LFTSIAEERVGIRPAQDSRPTYRPPGEPVEPPDSYNLRPFFRTPLNDADAITYRHQVIWDLECGALRDQIRSFAQSMRSMRQHLRHVNKLHYYYQKAGWFADAVEIYCGAVSRLASGLPDVRRIRAALNGSVSTSRRT
jgi:hypothetical protein